MSLQITSQQALEKSINLSLVERSVNTDFHLYLALYAPDVSSELRYTQSPNTELAFENVSDKLHFYPEVPLKTTAKDWQYLDQETHLTQKHQWKSVQLWRLMHPVPLSQYNDATYLNEEVVANTHYQSIIHSALSTSRDANASLTTTEHLIDNTLLAETIPASLAITL